MSSEELISHAHAAEPGEDASRPIDLHLDRREGLRITWADGQEAHFPLAFLRKNCPCATCRSNTPEEPAAPRGLSLTVLPANIDRAVHFRDARLVGNYAMQITWDDGHSTGIYDFRYLRMLGEVRGGGKSSGVEIRPADGG